MLASSLWALATMVPLGVPLPREMVQALLLHSEHLAPQFEQQDISNMCWAVATMKQKVHVNIDVHACVWLYVSMGVWMDGCVCMDACLCVHSCTCMYVCWYQYSTHMY